MANEVSVIAVRRFLRRRDPTRPPARNGARMALYPEDGIGRAVFVPYAPTGVDQSNLAAEWVEVSRPGMANALLYSAQPLPRLSCTVFIVDKVIHTSNAGQPGDIFQSATDALTLLRRYAAAGTRMRLAYSTMESGSWRITNLSINPIRRDPTTDEITQAEVSLELTKVSDITAGLGPVTGGVQQPAIPTAPVPTAPANTRYYKVISGDTLWGISIKFYQTGFRWRDIANANGVTDPRTLQVGMTLRIP